MPSLTLKNVPDELLERLRARARHERRSLSSQALYLLERSMQLEPPAVPHGPEVAEAQVEAWRRAASRWHEQPGEDVMAAIQSARRGGRDVDL